jgi:hypothetical protein
MSYLDLGIKFHTEPTHNKFVPKLWIADGIRRSVEDLVLQPGTQFVSKEDYDKMAYASELAATDASKHNYRAGRIEGFLAGVGSSLVLAAALALMSTLTGCATPRSRPLAPHGPVRTVSSRVANVVATDREFVWIKFTGEHKAMPVRIVDDLEVSMMVPGTAVTMVKVTDSAGVGLEVRGGRPGEKVMAVMIVQ